MRYRSQSWLNNKTRGSHVATRRPSYITGSHSMKFGYQGNYWRDDREMHVNSQSLGYIGDLTPGRAVLSDLDSTSTSTRTS